MICVCMYICVRFEVRERDDNMISGLGFLSVQKLADLNDMAV